MKLRDMTGEIIGRLTVLRRGENGPKGQTQWVCVCACDPTREVLAQASGMAAGRTRSCGCLLRETAGDGRRTHAKSNTPVYRSWMHAKMRCTNKRHPKWRRYGGRGITMCARWLGSFEAFYADMSDPPARTSIDRIDNDGHYSCGRHDLCDDCRARNLPTNCRWATHTEQMRNMCRNAVVTIGRDAATLAEWSERSGLDYDRLRARRDSGETGTGLIDSASHEPTRLITGPDGTTLRLSEWARRTGISAATILWRIKDGWSEALAASTPKTHRYYPAKQKQ